MDFDQKLWMLGENIDHLINLEIRTWTPLQILRKLYDSARQKINQPLAMLAAKRIMESVKPGDSVILGAGFVVDYWLPRGEEDGLVGACTLARILRLGLDARPLILCEEPVIPVITAGCLGAGIRTFSYQEYKKIEWATAVCSFPIDMKKAKEEAIRILEEVRPSAIISVEKVGPNEKGVYHTGLGNDMGPVSSKFDILVEEAKKRGILTIGFVDLGNEVGAGFIYDAIRQILPLGSKCNCGCGGGIASVCETDIGVLACKCNWAAYGVEAAIAALLKNPRLIHTPEDEKRIHFECLRAGMFDGVTLNPSLSLCGIPISVTNGVLEMLRELVDVALSTPPKPDKLGRY